MKRNIDASVSPQAQALSLYIQNAVEQLRNDSARSQTTGTQDSSGLLFLGNWQDAFPRLLVTDPILEPVDKIVWQVIRIHVNAPGAVTTFPSYESISTYANIKSNHTIARALAILRATRWLSLCARVRGESGRYMGNIYVLHDEPVTLGDAMYLDSEYMSFLQDSIQHRHPRVRKISDSVLATIQEQIEGGRDTLGERIHTRSYERRIGSNNSPRSKHEATLILSARTDFFAISDAQIKSITEENGEDGKHSHVQIMHLGESDQTHLVQNSHLENSEEESQVQNMHLANDSQKMHTVLHSSSNKNTTTTCSTPQARHNPDDELHFPSGISANERNLAMMYLRPIECSHKQDVLDEWSGRLHSAINRNKPIDNPIGYLATLCRRAKTGEFQLTIGLRIRDKREQAQKCAEDEKRKQALENQRQQELIKTLETKPDHKMTRIEKRLRDIQTNSAKKNE